MKKFLLILFTALIMLTALASCGEQKVYHTVKFEYGTEETPDYIRYEYGSLINEPEAPVKEGYTFLGWYSKKNGERWNFETDKLTTDVTLIAKWKRITKTVTFNSDGGDAISEMEIGIGDLIPKPQNPTKKDHFFKGWFLLDTEWNFEEDRVSKDITLIAKWEPCPTFTVKFDTMGGSAISDKHVVLNDYVPIPDSPVRDGYIFMDWLYNGVSWNFAANKVTSDITLTADWRKIEIYTVSFDTDGGSAVNHVMVTEGNKLPTITPPTKRYYIFDGWTNNGEKIDITTFIPTESLTLKAKWIHISEKKYTITFDADNGTQATTDELHGYSLISLPQEPTKQGYRFLGWFNGEIKWNFEIDRVEGDTLLKAKWSQDVVTLYKVTFDPDNGDSPTLIDVSPNDRISLPSEPKKQGFAFDGWYLGETAWNFEMNEVTSDIVLKAKWVTAYTVTFITDGGTSVETQYIRENKCIKYDEAISTKEGYILDGWYNGNVKWNAYDRVMSDITLTAKWREPRIFKIYYDFDEAKSESPDEALLVDMEAYLSRLPEYVVEGQKLTHPEAPIPENDSLCFTEWKILKVDSYGKEHYETIDFGTFVALESYEMPKNEKGEIYIELKAYFGVYLPPVPIP